MSDGDMFTEWEYGMHTDDAMLHALLSEYGEIKSALAPHVAEEKRLRKRIEQVMLAIQYHTGEKRVVHAGFGTITLIDPTPTTSYNKKKLDALLIELTDTDPAMAARIKACRTTRTKDGYMTIEMERKDDHEEL